MKTNWEKDIKKQLENREVEVSEDARRRFQELSGGIQVSKKPKLRMAWAIAAAVLLLAGISFISRLMSEGNSEISLETIPPIVQTEKASDFSEQSQSIKKMESGPENGDFRPAEARVREKEKPHSDGPAYTKVENQAEPENEQLSESVEIAISNEFPEAQEDTLNRWKESLLTSSEQSKEAEAKTSYTDPELLLYSVENDEVIKQKRTGARIVLIDFNK